jgi:hypothetical protein
MTAAMLRLLLVAFVLATMSGLCRAQTVTLAIVRLGCGSPLSPLFTPPQSAQEREQISAEWVEADELAVEAWDEETADSQVDSNTAKLRMDGATVILDYSHRRVVADRHKPTPECLYLAKLFFTVSGLPRSHYELRVENERGTVREVEISENSDFIFVGLVTKISAAPVEGSNNNWVVATVVEKIESGKFGSKTFSFRMHSPTRAGLVVGKRYHFHATGSGGGYTVDEFRITPQD